jgi:hypothetical protein
VYTLGKNGDQVWSWISLEGCPFEALRQGTGVRILHVSMGWLILRCGRAICQRRFLLAQGRLSDLSDSCSIFNEKRASVMDGYLGH